MARKITIDGVDFAVTDTAVEGGTAAASIDQVAFAAADATITPVADVNGQRLPVTDSAVATAVASVLAKLTSDPATQTTLAAVLAKLSADPATQTTLAALLAKVGDGSALFKKTPLASNTPARVASSATVIDLVAANASRRALKIFNESTAVLYVKDGNACSITDYSVQVAAGGYYEWPLPIYTGKVTGLWASANGAAQITEGV